jgi:hypothetical protein
VGGRGRSKGKKTKNVSSPTGCPGEKEEEIVTPQNGTVLVYIYIYIYIGREKVNLGNNQKIGYDKKQQMT